MPPLFRLLSLLALILPLSACLVAKQGAESASPDTTADMQAGQERQTWLAVRNQAITQLRQNPHISVSEQPNGEALVQIRSGNIFRVSSMLINPQVRPVFEHIVSTLNAHPRLVVRVIGHSDNSGDTQQNLVLSIRRAESARNELVKLGLNESRVSYDGRGDAEPIAPNTSEEGRAVNRRVDLLILGRQPGETSTESASNAAQPT